MRAISCVTTPVWTPTSALRVCSSITISSSDALPARSPMPLIAHSTCRAPACTPANEFATARPRSSWQWTLRTTSFSPGRQRVELLQVGRELVRHRVADGVGDVDRRRALVDRERQTSAVKSTSARVASIGENSTSSTYCFACATPARVRPLTSSRVAAHLVLDVDVGRGDERVDARSLRVLDGVPCGVDVARVGARQARDDRSGRRGPNPARAIAWTASKSPGEEIGKPASMTSTPRRASWWAISSFSLVLSEMPGDCSPSRSVVSKISTRLGSCSAEVISSSPQVARASLLLGRFAATCGRHALFPPRGEEKKSKGELARHLRRAYQAAGAATGRSNCSSSSGRTDDIRSPRRCSSVTSPIATTVTANRITATTLTSGGTPRWAAPKMNSGKVCVCPS